MKEIIEFFLKPQILWLTFIVVAVGVVFCSKRISKYVAAISEKTSLGGAFLGAFVLSLVTSIPELVSSVTSSLIGNPTLSYGNVIGVNMLTLTFLAVLDIIFIKKRLFSKISNTNRKTIAYVFGFNVLMVLCLFIKPLNNALTINLGFTHISLVFFLMVVLYIIYIYRVYKTGQEENDEDAESSGCEHMSLKKVVVLFFVYSVLLITLSIMIANITDRMGEPIENGGYGLGSAVAGAIFLSICTGLPEMTSAISLAKMGQGNMALGGIIGSHFFNFTIFFVGDLFFFKSGSMQQLYLDNVQYVTIKVTILVGMLLNLLLFSNTFKKNVKNKFVYLLPCVIIIALYIVFWFTKDNIIALFL